MELQVAIDNMEAGEALAFARRVEPYADIIEVGTPLIYRYGLELVTKMKCQLKSARLLADPKIVDAGKLEARMFLEAGADIITLLAGASNTTLQQAAQIADELRGELMIDLIDIPASKQGNRLDELYQIGYSCFCLHRPSDVSDTERLVLPDISGLSGDVRLAVAGGINFSNLDGVLDYNPAVVIVGSAITGHQRPRKQARRFKQKIEERGGRA